MTLRYTLLAALVVAVAPVSLAQIGIATSGTANVQDFESFTGTGFSPTPAAGQLNSNAFLVRGVELGTANASTLFGGTYTTGEFARGRRAAPTSLAGVYSFSVTADNLGTFGAQPNNAGVFAPGALYVRYRNDTGAAVTSALVDYQLFTRNDQTRSNSLFFSYRVEAACASTDPTAGSYEAVPAVNYVSIQSPFSNDILVLARRSARLSGFALPNGGCLTLRFSTDQFAGTGLNDELSVDNLSVTLDPTPLVAQTITQTLSDGSGLRLLSSPVQGVSVGDLAAVNLVQGIPAGGGNPQQQYPVALPNLFTSYVDGEYGAPPNTGFVTTPGRGFYWQFYDQTIASDPGGPFGGGTSQSYPIPERQLTATGVPVTTTTTVPFETSSNDVYMIGNPFPQAILGRSILVQNNTGRTRGIQGNVFYAYNTVTGSYQMISRSIYSSLPKEVAVWQGLFAELISGITAPTFAFTALSEDDATFYGRPAFEATVALTLRGTTVSGVVTTDEAAVVQLTDDADASAGWDVLDASKLYPFASTYALVAPVLDRDGAPYRAALSTLPVAETTVPLQILATEAGTYTLTADGEGLPAGWSAEVRDMVTGAVARLEDGYTFTTEATDWTARFELVLLSHSTSASPAASATVALSAPAPNPTSRQSTMTLRVDAPQRVTATVIDALGRTVATVFDGDLAAGADAQITVDALRLAPGLYVIRVAGESFGETRRITVVR